MLSVCIVYLIRKQPKLLFVYLLALITIPAIFELLSYATELPYLFDKEKLAAVKVSLPGGKVRVTWQGPDTPVKMAGPATLVYEGQLTL